MKTLKSTEDRSVNFILEKKNGFLEARYVQRTDDYFIVYLSSHSGCKLACRFCHLTATGQTSFDETTLDEYIEQAKIVLSHYDKRILDGNLPSKKVHYNFMARGEPFSNETVLKNGLKLWKELKNLSEKRGLEHNIKLSSIFPTTMNNNELFDIIGHENVMPYYSLYSLDEKFRKRWIPKSMEPDVAFKKIQNFVYKRKDEIPFSIHWAFIKGENDNEEGIEKIVKKLKHFDLLDRVKMNVVRYNPYSDKQGEESDEHIIQRNFNHLISHFGEEGQKRSRIVPRVGFDVKASCGMFIKPD